MNEVSENNGFVLVFPDDHELLKNAKLFITDLTFSDDEDQEGMCMCNFNYSIEANDPDGTFEITEEIEEYIRQMVHSTLVQLAQQNPNDNDSGC